MPKIERNVTVDTKDLLATLQENKKEHQEVYQKVLVKYLEQANKMLEDRHKKAQDQFDSIYTKTKQHLANFDPKKASNTIVVAEPICFNLVCPVDYSEEYSRAISMLEWEKEDKITLTPNEFRYFVMDDWDWSDSFSAVTGLYFE